MIRKILVAAAAALAITGIAACAHAQTIVPAYQQQADGSIRNGIGIVCLSGCGTPTAFTPTAGATATLAVTTTSADVTLPAGANIIVTNTGANDAAFRIQTGAGTAVVTDYIIKAGAAVGLGSGAATHLSAITSSGTTSLNIQGGSGGVAGYGGGGGSGGGGAVTLADGADTTQGAKADTAATTDTGTFSFVALFKRLLQGVTTLNGAVSTAANQTTLNGVVGAQADAAAAADTSTASVVALLKRNNQNITTLTTQAANPIPTQASTVSIGGVGLLAGTASVGNVGVDPSLVPATTAVVNVSTATTTQLVALSASKLIYVTGGVIMAGGTGNVTLEYGTGTNCNTGTTVLSGAIPLIANVGFIIPANTFTVPASQALCVLTSAAVQYSGAIGYVQK